MTWLHSLCEKD